MTSNKYDMGMGALDAAAYWVAGTVAATREKTVEELNSELEKSERQREMLQRGMVNLGMQLSHQCDATASEQEMVRLQILAHNSEVAALHKKLEDLAASHASHVKSLDDIIKAGRAENEKMAAELRILRGTAEQGEGK